jgi:hypothetical protein
MIEVLGNLGSEACQITLSVCDQAEAYYVQSSRCYADEKAHLWRFGIGIFQPVPFDLRIRRILLPVTADISLVERSL